MELIDNLRLPFLYWIDGTFKSTTKSLSADISDSVDKPKNLSNCMFPLVNLQSAESLYCVPETNQYNYLIYYVLVQLICNRSVRSRNNRVT